MLWEADLEENALIKIFMIYVSESCKEAKPGLIALQKTVNRHFTSGSNICEQVIISEGFMLIMRGASLTTLLETMTEIFGEKYAARLEQIKDEVSDGHTNEEAAEKLANGRILINYKSLDLSANQIDDLKISQLGRKPDS